MVKRFTVDAKSGYMAVEDIGTEGLISTPFEPQRRRVTDNHQGMMVTSHQ